MYEYIVTYSGGEEIDIDGVPWTNASNIFDGDETTSGTSYGYSEMGSPGPPTYGYWWNWTYTNDIFASGNDNTTDSGTILGVFVRIYGHREQEDYKDSIFHVLPYVDGDLLWYHQEYMLTTMSGEDFVSASITDAKETWTWDNINTLELDIYQESGPWTDRLDFWISKVELLIVAEDE
jgi:hypothetical protein